MHLRCPVKGRLASHPHGQHLPAHTHQTSWTETEQSSTCAHFTYGQSEAQREQPKDLGDKLIMASTEAIITGA